MILKNKIAKAKENFKHESVVTNKFDEVGDKLLDNSSN